jgi:hypothetical protein
MTNALRIVTRTVLAMYPTPFDPFRCIFVTAINTSTECRDGSLLGKEKIGCWLQLFLIFNG